MEVDGVTGDVGPWDAIAIPPGSSHKLTNTGSADMVLLCCCTPAYAHDDTVMEEDTA
jgi:mannose-6-phosphate isomerase-like protein (cupin superfamily)